MAHTMLTMPENRPIPHAEKPMLFDFIAANISNRPNTRKHRATSHEMAAPPTSGCSTNIRPISTSRIA